MAENLAKLEIPIAGGYGICAADQLLKHFPRQRDWGQTYWLPWLEKRLRTDLAQYDLAYFVFSYWQMIGNKRMA